MFGFLKLNTSVYITRLTLLINYLEDYHTEFDLSRKIKKNLKDFIGLKIIYLYL